MKQPTEKQYIKAFNNKLDDYIRERQYIPTDIITLFLSLKTDSAPQQLTHTPFLDQVLNTNMTNKLRWKHTKVQVPTNTFIFDKLYKLDEEVYDRDFFTITMYVPKFILDYIEYEKL